MSEQPEHTSRDWFEKASLAYLEGHQACAWCGEPHQVYKGERGSRQEFYCPACDFYTFHDVLSGQFFAAPGHGEGSAASAPGTICSSGVTV
jgi:hypothetical protein